VPALRVEHLPQRRLADFVVIDNENSNACHFRVLVSNEYISA
jgi:hypothetical protein